MTRFLALYDGQTVNTAEVVAFSVDPQIVGAFEEVLLPWEERSQNSQRGRRLKVVEGGRDKKD